MSHCEPLRMDNININVISETPPHHNSKSEIRNSKLKRIRDFKITDNVLN